MKQKTTLLLLLLCMSYNAFAQCYSSVRSCRGSIIARQTDGSLWGKGLNQYSNIGDGTTNLIPNFIQIGTSYDWSENYSVGEFHTLAIKNNGTLWVWGKNVNGCLGLGISSNFNNVLPTQIGNDTNWISVASGGTGNSLGVKADGTLWSWGSNSDGQLGINSTETLLNQLSPLQVGTETNWLKVFAYVYSCYGIKNDGTLWSWGRNDILLGYVGLANDHLSPHLVGSSTDVWSSVSSDGQTALALKSDGTIWIWGIGQNGQFGDGSPFGTVVESYIPTQIGLDNDWQQINNANGYAQCIALKTNHTRWGWGYNYNYTLGNGTSTPILVPTQLDSDTDWIFVDLDQEALQGSGNGIKQNNSLYHFGYDYVSGTIYQLPTLQGLNCTLSNTNYNNGSQLEIYPNPAHDKISICYFLQQDSDVNISITNALGQLVYDYKKNVSNRDNQETIDINDYASGIYFLSLQAQSSIFTTKFIKQ